MLFPEFKFLFLFLPIVFITFFYLYQNSKRNWLVYVLLFSSLIFYLLPNWNNAHIIIASIVFNYVCSRLMHKWKGKEILFLYSGVLFNLSVICYYKYAYFFSENISYFIELPFNINKFILPVGISFYTFQQIAFLVDCYHDKKVSYNLHEYSLFVTFFPQLIAGPIVHHKDLVPQLINLGKHKFNTAMASVGLSIFIVGIFKKLVLADNFAPIANRVFDSFSQGVSTDLITAWLGALGYSLQLYFDFSAYSDMAIGLGLIFGIKLPINFNSPYKATSIIDFWRRWHITLSQFLRDYVYFSLGGNRKGTSRRYINLMLTMLIGGLWHGAGWTFIAWGFLHSIYLVIVLYYLCFINLISLVEQYHSKVLNIPDLQYLFLIL